MNSLSVGAAGAQTGWSARMLRYLEGLGLVVPKRTAAGYRSTGSVSSTSCIALRELRRRFAVELGESPLRAPSPRAGLRAAVETWLHGADIDALDWEQRKHERLLAA